MPAKRHVHPRRTPVSRPSAKNRHHWSARVTRESDALDLKRRVFTGNDPKRIARSLKRSAESSSRRKGTPFQSAMAMLNFYLNRGGRNLSVTRRRVLARAKVELRRIYDRPTTPSRQKIRQKRG